MENELINEMKQLFVSHSDEIQKCREIILDRITDDIPMKITNENIDNAIVSLKVIHGLDWEEISDAVLNMIDEAINEEEECL